MHRAIKPHPHHLGDAARIVAVSLVNLRLQRRYHVPRLDTDYRQAHFGKRAEQPLRQRSSFQPNSLEVVGGVLQHRQQRCRLARYLHFTNDLARVIHNADARVLDRNVQSSKMLHAALLLLMLEAAQRGPRFTISLKRSTQILQLSTSCRPITPSSGTSRHSSRRIILVAIGLGADIGWALGPDASVAIDPCATSASSSCCSCEAGYA